MVADAFSRTVQRGWGSTDPGGSYKLRGKAGDFDVNANEGTIRLSGKKRSVILPQATALDASARVRVTTDTQAVGGVQIMSLILRRNTDGEAYLGNLRLAANGNVSLQAARLAGGHVTVLGSQVKVPKLKHHPGQFIYLRMQVTGTDPTTIQLRAWAAGQTEPGSAQYTVTDSSPSLQQVGSVGIRVGASRKVTNGPFVFSFDDLNITSGGTDGPPPSSDRIYWGALVEGAAPTGSNLAASGLFGRFEKNAGKKMAILHWGLPWKMNGGFMAFQSSYMTAVRQRGSIPFLDWGSFELGKGINQPAFQLRDIYEGSYDSYIRQFARDAKAWGHPFFVRFDWEMNGDWQFPWSEKLNGNQPGDYVKMWRHVHDIFTQEGTRNISWVWCPNIASDKTTPMSSVYPGDAYVDWTCLDGYNKDEIWLDFEQVFGADGINWLHNSYQEITSLAPNKPLVIGETASLEAGDGGSKKAEWIRNALQTQLPSRFPKVQAVLWFNWDDRNPDYSFPIESSQAAKQAFAESIGSSYYAANEFSNLDRSPIPPLH